MDMRIPPLESNMMFESNPLKSRIVVWRLAVGGDGVGNSGGQIWCSRLAQVPELVAMTSFNRVLKLTESMLV